MSCLFKTLKKNLLFLFSRPPHLDDHFIFPDSSPTDIENLNILPNHKVRIAASFDMGWTTRGTGTTYDSLSGLAELIGALNKKVFSWITLNCKCKICDNNIKKNKATTHDDCRLNFEGSAKAMDLLAIMKL